MEDLDCIIYKNNKSFTSIDKMGPGNEATKMIGTDEYGNQYYEDFHTYCNYSCI